MTSARLIVVLAAGLACAGAFARDIHYGAVTDPEILECDAKHWRGRVDESALCYANLLRSETPASTKAEAAWALNNLKQANEWFRAAMAESPDDHATKVRWGDLFAASHQDGEAMEIYREVLAVDAGNAFAMMGAARVLVDSFEEAANSYIEPILEGVVPDEGALLGAWLLIARVGLENGNYDEARDALDHAADLIAKNEWPPVELYALRESLDLLTNRDTGDWTQQSLDFNPRWGGIYAVPAHFYVITRRYRAAIDLFDKAVEIEPGLAAAHEELGINLLRDNQMTRARGHLEMAYERDPFSPRAVNTLRLMDSYVNFRLIEDMPDTDKEVPVILRLHKDEADAIAPYAIEIVRASIDVYTERYGFELREPVVVEMYPDHEDFAVRTAGMPGLGILGAAFGYVIAMDSPSGRSPDEFQWGNVLWHEMAHVFTLEATNHLVPRWFSEGVSVFEEWRSGPNPGVRIPMSVYNAMKDDLLLPIAQLDEGFVRPTYANQVIVSYMQAGLVCDFIDRHVGPDKLREMLVAFRDGMLSDEAIATVIGVTPDEFDDAFAHYVEAEHGQFLEKLDAWHETQTGIAGKIEAGEWEGAITMADELIGLLPQYVEPDSPYLAKARAQRESGDDAGALATLETYWREGGSSPVWLKRLADLFADAGREDDAIAVHRSINLVDPLDSELHGEFGDMLLQAGRAEEARREYEIAIFLQPHDMATAWYRLARAEYALGNVETSQGHLLQALDVAPSFRPAQRLLLQLASAGADPRDANNTE